MRVEKTIYYYSKINFERRAIMTNDIRQNNKEMHIKSVLNHIRKYSPISRVELCKALRISKPTITNIINDLLSKGLVIETGTVQSNSGRRRIHLEINAEAGFCIGLCITRTMAYASIIDINLHIRYSVSTPINHSVSASELNTNIIALIERLLRSSKVDFSKLLGIGIAAPGFIDYKNGILLNFEIEKNEVIEHTFKEVPIKKCLSNHFNLPVMVENDANVRVLGEYWYGYGVNYNNILLVLCDEGIGSGIIQRGHILRGEISLNHGIGHLSLDPHGPLCTCGRHGCIESYASRNAIFREIKKRRKAGEYTSLTTSDDKLLINEIGLHADKGDPLCCDVLNRAASAIGQGIAMLSGIVNPEIIIITGGTADANSYFYNTIVDEAKKYSFEFLRKYLKFQRRLLNDNVYEMGAAVLIFQKYVY
jgi:predicted NBD/HSP70 family sugar kinase/DNA-binding MarR family transcriptional regulator